MFDRGGLNDVIAVAMKELEVSLRADRRLSALGYRLFWALLFAIVMPLMMRDRWFVSPEVMALWAWLPVFVTSPMLGSAIAGEREQRTLETLLATRLPDRAIVFGKVVAASLVGWAYALCSIFGGALAVSLLASGTGPMFYRPEYLVGGVVCSYLGAWFGAAAGIASSVRCATQRQAQDNISLVTMGVTFAAVVIRSILDALGLPLSDMLLVADGWWLTLGFAVTLLLADLGASRVALTRFKRSALLPD